MCIWLELPLDGLDSRVDDSPQCSAIKSGREDHVPYFLNDTYLMYVISIFWFELPESI